MITQDIKDLIDRFIERPSKFRNQYRNSKRGSKKDFANYVDSLIPKTLRDHYGEGKFAQLFYDMLNPNYDNSCKVCRKSTKFTTFESGYDSYCCIRCARSDASRVPDESRKIGTEKRRKKMREMLDDPIRGKEYRDKISVKSKLYMGRPDVREKRSNLLKDKIKDGTWTPERTSSRTRWAISIDGRKMRSSFEAIYLIYNRYYKGNNEIEYEAIRLEYKFNNKRSIYIVDFIDNSNRLLVEVKPTSKINEPRNIAKEQAGKKWADINKFKYIIVNENDIKDMYLEMLENNFNHEFLDEFSKKYPKWKLD